MSIPTKLLAEETEIQRLAIKRVFTGAEWSKRINLMAPDKVAAVYQKLKSENRLR